MLTRATPETQAAAARTGALAAACTVIGAIASGPLAMFIVHVTHPQPDWQNARVFAQHYHAIQTLPFFLGFLLVCGFVVLIVSLHALADQTLRLRTQAALVFTSVFAALVLLNYAVQTTFVPRLVEADTDANDALLGALTMSNPRSLAWSLEMWGYGWLGVATWLVAPVLSRTPRERATAWMFVANGPVSLAGAIATACDAGWLMTMPGLLAFAAWNALVMVMSALCWSVLRARLRNEDA